MRVSVNMDLCCGHGLCVGSASNIFEMDDDDKAHVIMEHPPESERDNAMKAMRICPQMAIDVQE